MTARETYVLIPTMAEVAAARQLMRAAGKGAETSEAASLGPGSGLVPIFWSEALAVQVALTGLDLIRGAGEPRSVGHGRQRLSGRACDARRRGSSCAAAPAM